jgi:hypothetical protein
MMFSLRSLLLLGGVVGSAWGKAGLYVRAMEPLFKSRELISAQGLNIAGFEFGCDINVNLDCVQAPREATDQALRERVRLIKLSRRC